MCCQNELLMREALEGMATASVAHQHVEPRTKLDSKNDRLGDLTNQLNKLRSVTAKVRSEARREPPAERFRVRGKIYSIFVRVFCLAIIYFI